MTPRYVQFVSTVTDGDVNNSLISPVPLLFFPETLSHLIAGSLTRTLDPAISPLFFRWQLKLPAVSIKIIFSPRRQS